MLLAKVVLIVAKCIVNCLWKFNRSNITGVLIVAKCIVNTCRIIAVIKGSNVLIVAKCIVNGTARVNVLSNLFVLIVAKCIVNLKYCLLKRPPSSGINSSKVYCKFRSCSYRIKKYIVLIVAKCIVNKSSKRISYIWTIVLIVAKCIVNREVAKKVGKRVEY